MLNRLQPFSLPSRLSADPQERSSITNDTVEITQLVLKERQGRDRGWWDQMAACFHPESMVHLSWIHASGAEFVARSKAMSVNGLRSTHQLSPPVIHLAGARAVVELPLALTVRSRVDGVEADLVSHMRVLYQVERSDSNWKIMIMNSIYERDTLTPAMLGTELSLNLERLAEFRMPYRCLAYVLNLNGRIVGDDLFADDHPDKVNALYALAFKWLEA